MAAMNPHTPPSPHPSTAQRRCRWLRRLLALPALAALSALSALSLASHATGLPGPAPSHNLGAALTQAWQLNAEAIALDARRSAASAAQTAAASWTPDAGALSLASTGERPGRRSGNQEYEAELSTPLWLPGQQAASAELAQRHADEVTARQAALRLEIAGQLRSAWWSLAAARAAATLAQQRNDTARALANDVQRRHRAGDLSRIDANLAEAEVAAATTEQLEAQAAAQEAELALQTLTGQPPPAELAEENLSDPTPPHTPADARTPADAALTHPLLAAATASTQVARARLRLAEESGRAAPELALRVTRERSDDATAWDSRIGIKLTLPFLSSPRRHQENASAQAEALQAEATQHRLANQLTQATALARRHLQSARQQLTAAQTRQQLDAENLALAEKAFALGEFDLPTLLRMRAASHAASHAARQRQIGLAAAISRLNQALGILP
jgi:cobalt-zinc-cadmium efflux system outer membrane protein